MSTKNPSVDIVFRLFKELNRIPRPSKSEVKATEFLVKFAKHRGLDYSVDLEGCVVIRKGATKGYEEAPIVVLQSNIDMVCLAAKGKKFNPLEDRIETYIDNGWLRSKGTSMGADSGIGVCMMLAILDSDSIEHPALECLFTTNKEEGMTGVSKLSKDFIKGRRVINLDSEDYDKITVASAAAYLQKITLPFNREASPQNYKFYDFRLFGGVSGHSGVDITRGRSNALKVTGEFLHACNVRISDLCLCSIFVGEASNTIPANVEAVFGMEIGSCAVFEKMFLEYRDAIKARFAESDPDMDMTLTEIETPKYVISKKGSDGLYNLLNALPFGVTAKNKELSGEIVSSNNLGMLYTEEDQFVVVDYARTAHTDDVQKIATQVREAATEVGANVEVIMDAPAWSVSENSVLVKSCAEAFKDVLNVEPELLTMHFALECGYLEEKFEGCDIISIGPRILDINSINESVDIESVNGIWQVLLDLLKKLRNS